VPRRDWLSVLRLCAWMGAIAGAFSGIALADEIRRTRAAHLPTAWLSAGMVACLAVLLVSVLGAITTERE